MDRHGATEVKQGLARRLLRLAERDSRAPPDGQEPSFMSAFVTRHRETIAEAVRLLIRHKLDRDWSAASVAESFSMSEATLRRRLRREGQSLRILLLSERMKAAHTLLSQRDAEVADAIAATGYLSRSHFARHFHDAFGMSPSEARHRPEAIMAD